MNRNRPTLHTSGFTLIELLTACSLLILLLAFVFQLTNTTNQIIQISNRTADATTQVRQAFGRMGLDLDNLIARPDVDFEAGNPGFSDNALLFLSNIGTSSTGRGASVIGYRIASHPDNAGRRCLLRAGKEVGWATTGYFGYRTNDLPVLFSDSDFPTSALPAPSDYEILAPGVIAMVVGFQLAPDNLPATLADGSTIAACMGQVVYSAPVRTTAGQTLIDPTRVSSLIIGIVALDEASLSQLNAGQIETLALKFTRPAAGSLPMATWGPLAESLTSLPELSAMPLSALQAVRVFQRAFPLATYRERSL